MSKNVLVCIDCQFDFCNPKGALYVKNAEKDMLKLSKFINKNLNKINTIVATLDLHHLIDIAHPIFWKNEMGENPAPFTSISKYHLDNKKWIPIDNRIYELYKHYNEDMNIVTIWPPHCLIGTKGSILDPNISSVFSEWSKANLKQINYIRKGENPFTEHFSAVKADLELDSYTGINQELMKSLNEADNIFWSGEASSHCVANTVQDCFNIYPELAKKSMILFNTMSAVPGFEELEKKFFNFAQFAGATLCDKYDS